MAKSTKIIAALGVAGMLGGIALPTFAASTGLKQLTDQVTVTVEGICGFQSETSRSDTYEVEALRNEAGKDYTGSAATGSKVDFDSGEDGQQDAVHNFKVRCNNPTGYTVKAVASGLTGKSAAGSALTGEHNAISYITPKNGALDADYEHYVADIDNKEDGYWTALVSGTSVTGDYTIYEDGVNKTTGTEPNQVTGLIVEKNTAAASAGVDFAVTYKAFAGKSTQAGTYTGTIVYTLAEK